MLQTENHSDPEAMCVHAVADSKSLKTKPQPQTAKSSDTILASKKSDPTEWDEVKKVRNRINSQRTRERERNQIKSLEAERSRLILSNDAIKFQNQRMREVIAQITEIRELKRIRMAANGGQPNVPSVIFGNSGGLGPGASLGMLGGIAGGMDGDLLFQSSRLPTSGRNFSGISNTDLLARRNMNGLELHNLMRQQASVDQAATGAFNLALNGRFGGGTNDGPGVLGMNINMVKPGFGDVDGLRFRQLMMQNSTGDFDPKHGLKSICATDALNLNGLGNHRAENLNNSDLNQNRFLGGMGSLGESAGPSDAEFLHMSKRQKLGL